MVEGVLKENRGDEGIGDHKGLFCAEVAFCAFEEGVETFDFCVAAEADFLDGATVFFFPALAFGADFAGALAAAFFGAGFGEAFFLAAFAEEGVGVVRDFGAETSAAFCCDCIAGRGAVAGIETIWGCPEGTPKPMELAGCGVRGRGCAGAFPVEDGCAICGNCGVLVSTMISPLHLSARRCLYSAGKAVWHVLFRSAIQGESWP